MKDNPTWPECFDEWKKSESPAVQRMIRRCEDLYKALTVARKSCPHGYEKQEVHRIMNKNPREYDEK